MDELRQAQLSVGRALGRARAGADPALAAIVRERGEQFANLFSGLLRMSRVHASDNRAFDQPVAELRAALVMLLELLGAVQLVVVEDQVYVNDLRIRPAAVQEGRDLGTELRAHNVGGLTFHSAPPEDRLRLLLVRLTAKPAAAKPRTALQRALEADGIEGVQLAPLHRFKVAGEEPAVQERASDPRMLAERTARLVEEYWDNLASGRYPNIVPLRRRVAELLEVGPGVDGLWADPPGVGAHAVHALRVGQIALLIGTAAGLGPSVLQDLGLAGLLHDAGYAAPGLRAGTPAATAAHPRAGLGLLLQQPGFHEGKLRRALGALDHHRDFNEAGARPSLFGRILRLAEDYANLVRKTGGRLPPTWALAAMASGANTRYDPVLLQLMINALGYYPPGTFLQLVDGRIVCSVSVARSPETFAAPRAVLVRLADGTTPREMQWLDLAQGPAVRQVLNPR